MPTMTMPTMPILGLTAIFRTGTHSSSLTLSSTKGAVPAELAGLKHAMSIRLDFLEIGEASRYDTAIDPGTSKKCIYSYPSRLSTHAVGTHNCPLISLGLIVTR
jgi:hypothetical protein